MALSLVLNRNFYRCMRLCTSSISNIHKNVSKSNSHLSVECDSIDEFTSHLLQRKLNKWSNKKSNQKFTEKVICLEHCPYENKTEDIAHLSETKLNLLFQTAMDISDNEKVLELIKQCIKLERCPSLSHILYILNICSQDGDKATIEEIRQLCDKLCPEVLETNSSFQHYVAEAMWMKGNINESLKLFKHVYTNNAYLRRRLRLMLKFLIVNTVSTKGEVALTSMIKFSEDLKNNYADFFPLMYVWQTCFLSEWFSDQCIAFDLLNEHDGLCTAVISRIPYVVAVSLQNHKTEVVHRLLEVLLHFDIKSQYERVLLALFDYQIHQGNIRRCLEIVQWSVQNNVQLPAIQHENFLSLLLDSMPDSDLKENTATKVTRPATHFKF